MENISCQGNVNSQGNMNSQGMDSGEIVVSSIRPGMKREFVMMMKTQSEMGGLTPGRRRVTRSQYACSSSKGCMPGGGKTNQNDGERDRKKLQRVGASNEDKRTKRGPISERSHVGDGLGDTDAKLGVFDKRELENVRADPSGGAMQPLCPESLCTEVGIIDKEVMQDGVMTSEEGGISTDSSSKLEMKMSKKVELKRFPTKLKDLLKTGLLEGLPVHYRGSKGTRRQGSLIRGTIEGTGIRCSCDECNGNEVVTPNQFELHAKSSNKRPPEYIILENGNSLRDVLNACKDNSSDSLLMAIQSAIGREDYTDAFCINCKVLISKAGVGRSMLLCDSCVPSKEHYSGCIQINDSAPRFPLAGLSSPSPSSSQPVVTESVETSTGNEPQSKRQGKITVKDVRMHKFVWAKDVLPEGSPLSYIIHGMVMLRGYKMDSGIFCMCCEGVVSPSLFEAHAGFSSRRKPYMGIYTSDGESLHALSVRLSRHRTSDPAESDDLCSICRYGGELLCCDSCPRAFHIVCVRLSSIPEGKWHCHYCHRIFEQEKKAKLNANAIASGKVPGIDTMEEINQRCTRVIETVEPDVGGCAICRGHDFESGFSDRTVLLCDQCEKEYHVTCLKKEKIIDLKELPECKWFCRTECHNIHSTLQKLIDDGEQRLPKPILDILMRKLEVQGSQQDPEPEIKWRLLRGIEAPEDTREWLSGAVSIFHGQFDPIPDANTGDDLIPHMVYGRKQEYQDFYGMYTVVLMVNSVVVTAGIFRVFGDEVAEIPLVATEADYQGKGYFKALYSCIESIMLSLNVKDLVLPAAHDAETMWKNKFRFQKLEEAQLEEYKKNYPMMIFQGTSVLHKSITQFEQGGA